ncbi:hypothetical protein RBH29_15970, partial [Herbivorax sp. ANBcel31]|uniref:hypothetical protein n=1 Tax=Herbivorax sp. ANBcel31 TaxID=3069754 RepID=UPI0027B049CB
PRPIASYPIGQFVFQIYSIIANGMTIEGFKMILYSNWHYNVNKTDEKWNEFISQFKNVHAYFENLTRIENWIEQAEKILIYKYETSKIDLYRWHPFNHIDIEFIKSLSDILKEIHMIINLVKDIEGSIEEHIEELKNQIMDAGRILNIEKQDMSFDQIIIKKFSTAISQIGKNSIVSGIDSNYFSDNLKGMLTDWEKDFLEDEIPDGIKINVVNLENMHKYKYSFFMMLESDKYPRKYKYEFPFTEEILQIMDDKKYEINKRPAEIHGIKYHLKLERYLFKNVLDFTKDKLYITFAEKEDKITNKPSIFVEDITSMFDENIEDVCQSNIIKSKTSFSFNKNKYTSIKLPKKKKYSVNELGKYMLCQRLYFQLYYNNQYKHIAYSNSFQLKFYCEAVLYCLVIEKFKEYSEANNIIYSAHNDEFYFIIKSLIEDCFPKVIKYFSFITEYEKKDIKNRVLSKVVRFIVGSIHFSKFNEFKVREYEETITSDRYKYNYIFENDILFTDASSKIIRRYQTKNILEFLTWKTGFKGNREEVKETNEIIEALEENDPDIDRISLTRKLIFRINVFFKDNYIVANEIAKKIENTDFKLAEMKKSRFCNYCMMEEMCKGFRHMSKEDRDEL